MEQAVLVTTVSIIQTVALMKIVVIGRAIENTVALDALLRTTFIATTRPVASAVNILPEKHVVPL